MTERRLMFIDIRPKTNSSTPVNSKAGKPLWVHSDNSFRFNFLPDSSPALQKETSPPADGAEAVRGRIPFTRQGSAFAFNFQIPSVEDVDMAETRDTPSPGSQQADPEEKLSLPQELSSPPELLVQTKAKKKKKSGTKKPSGGSEAQQKPSSAEGTQGVEDTELSAEEQLNRQLDWCIEQLELGMKSQKGTAKQKEEASRALKTLRSSKAPLAKKRQVMRATTGDYRQKMEEEKKKQYKLIQSEIASAQVKVVSESPKSCVFQRRAGDKSQPSATEKTLRQEDTSAFVFTPSKEEFLFNFF